MMKVTAHEYAQLTKHAMDGGKSNLPKGWAVFKRFDEMPNEDETKRGEGSKILKSVREGFDGVAYINHGSESIVIVSKGSVISSAFLFGDRLNDYLASKLNNPAKAADAQSAELAAFIGSLQECMESTQGPTEQAQAFSDFVSDVALKPQMVRGRKGRMSKQPAKTKDYEISYSGHGLGAMMSELIAIREGRVARTFESPGVHEIVLQQPDLYPSENMKNVTSYLGAPNFINTFNQHVGNVYRVRANLWQNLTRLGLQVLLSNKDFQGSMGGLMDGFGPFSATDASTSVSKLIALVNIGKYTFDSHNIDTFVSELSDNVKGIPTHAKRVDAAMFPRVLSLWNKSESVEAFSQVLNTLSTMDGRARTAPERTAQPG